MFIGYLNTRKKLGYECLIDTQCGIFIKNVPLNGKSKIKKLLVYGMFLFQLGQLLVPSATSVIWPLSPAIERSSPSEQDRILENKNGYPQIAIIPEPKVSKIRLTNDQTKQSNNIALQLNNGSIKMEEAILQFKDAEMAMDLLM